MYTVESCLILASPLSSEQRTKICLLKGRAAFSAKYLRTERTAFSDGLQWNERRLTKTQDRAAC